MVFERPLTETVSNWNISGDTFVFQEYTHESEIFVVKLLPNETPQVFKFELPRDT